MAALAGVQVEMEGRAVMVGVALFPVKEIPAAPEERVESQAQMARQVRKVQKSPAMSLIKNHAPGVA
ncbi:hypothetical protein VRB67_11320 [Pseudomonas trivialis]|uniref:hypothetical protein n=1 Tax=Pseudomonas trivialis TaxID=200450 RepID=UPI0030CE7B6D